MMRNEKPIKWMGYAFPAFPQDKYHVVLDPISILDILQFSGEVVIDAIAGFLKVALLNGFGRRVLKSLERL